MAVHFDITDMQLMVNVAAESSLTRGAEQTFLSLPAASNRVKNLEHNLRTQLLHRASQGVSLTASGEAFVEHARQVLRQIEYLQSDIKEYAEGVRGQVRVYANTTATHDFLPDVLEDYLAQHADVSMILRERSTRDVVDAVANGVADIGIAAPTESREGVLMLPWVQDHLVLIVPNQHALTEQTSCDFKDLLQYEMIGLFETSAIHSFLLRAAQRLDKQLTFRVEVENFETCCRLVAAHTGIAVIPKSSAQRYAEMMPIKVLPLNDTWATRRLHVCLREKASLPMYKQKLVDALLLYRNNKS